LYEKKEERRKMTKSDWVVGHPQQAPLWWKIATARSFILNRGIVTDTMSATPSWSQDGEQCIPLHQGCCQPGRQVSAHRYINNG